METGKNRRWPDTLNLEEYAERTLNCLTRDLDSPRSSFPYRPFFWTVLNDDPPRSYHNMEDHQDEAGRFLDAIILARQMSGSKLNAEVDGKLKSLILSYIGDDGLYHSPKAPWTWRVVSDFPEVVFIPGHMSVFYGLVAWFLESGDEKAKWALETLVRGLYRIAIKDADCCYFPAVFYVPGKGWETEKEPIRKPPWGKKSSISITRWTGCLFRPLVRYLVETGNSDVDKLLDQFIRWIMTRSKEFGEDGSFFGQVHSGTTIAHGVLEYGLYTGRKELVEWAKKIYGFVMRIGTKFGWFPETTGLDGCETCTIADMIGIAIELAKSGEEDYWNDAERFVRNHLTASQLVDTEWVGNLPKKSSGVCYQPSCPSFHEGYQDSCRYLCFTDRDVLNNVRGAFAGWSGLNDFLGRSGNYGIMHCCSAHGVDGLYYAWHHGIKEEEGILKVNLLLNRSTKWADVMSYLPYQGKIEVWVKDVQAVHIRIPDWAKKDKVKVSVRNNSKPIEFSGTFAKVEGVKSGDVVTLSFPLEEWSEEVIQGGRTYTVRWKGDTVVEIDPPGNFKPLYDRDRFRDTKAPMVERTLHRPQNEIDW